jgi:3-oxoacyl-[acyl-carrier-protein] synthase-1
LCHVCIQCCVAAVEKLTAEQIGGNPRYGIAGGSGGGSTASVVEMKNC